MLQVIHEKQKKNICCDSLPIKLLASDSATCKRWLLTKNRCSSKVRFSTKASPVGVVFLRSSCLQISETWFLHAYEEHEKNRTADTNGLSGATWQVHPTADLELKCGNTSQNMTFDGTD
jgi:hypothetical protein